MLTLVSQQLEEQLDQYVRGETCLEPAAMEHILRLPNDADSLGSSVGFRPLLRLSELHRYVYLPQRVRGE